MTTAPTRIAHATAHLNQTLTLTRLPIQTMTRTVRQTKIQRQTEPIPMNDLSVSSLSLSFQHPKTFNAGRGDIPCPR